MFLRPVTKPFVNYNQNLMKKIIKKYLIFPKEVISITSFTA